MSVQNVSSINASYIANSANKSVQTATQKEIKESKINAKKLAFSVAAAIGVTALAFGIVYNMKKGKINTGEDIKNFIDKQGNKIEGVKLEKGKAIAQDGSLFSGVMETLSNGRKVQIEYKDGHIVESKINGKLHKKFNNVQLSDGTILSREKAKTIIEYTPEGKLKNMSENLYYDNGKIKRHAGIYKAVDFFENGKIQAQDFRVTPYSDLSKIDFEPQRLSEISYPGNYKIYDENGKLIKEYNRSDYKLTEYLPNGSKKVFKGASIDNIGTCDSCVLTKDLQIGSKKLELRDKEGRLIKEFSESNEGNIHIHSYGDFEMFIHNNKDKNGKISNIRLTNEKDKNLILFNIDENGAVRLESASLEGGKVETLQLNEGNKKYAKSQLDKIREELKYCRENNLFGSLTADGKNFYTHAEEFLKNAKL